VLSAEDEDVAADTDASAASSRTLGEITVRDAHKAFGLTHALNGCNLRARRGEIHAIVGENGCGKSTLAKAISGVVPLDSGSVSVFGEHASSPNEARDLGIATVFQEVLVANEASVVDNLFVGSDALWTKSIPQREKRESAARVMEELAGVPVDPDTVVGTLPLSTKQWITIARALLRKPTVLILDESSAALDLDATERLFTKMRQCRDAGGAVFIVTHRIAELVRISDRATVLRDGYDVGVLEGSDITEHNLLQLMSGEEPVTSATDRSAPAPLTDRVVLQADSLQVWPDAAHLDFALHEGEIVGVAGLDGQGQDGFVRVLSGIAPAIDGVPTARTSRSHPAQSLSDLTAADRARISYVSGDRKREGILPNLSIYENVLLPQYPRARIGGWLGVIQWPELTGRFNREVDRLSIRLGDPADRITSLSGGNQQKAMIGRAFALNPRVLILNDPARGIDIGSKREIYGQLREYVAQGNSAIYLSSELEEFIGLCTRVIVFRNGSIFDEFVGEEVETHRILAAMFGQTSGSAGARRTGAPADEGSRRMKVLDFEQEDRPMVSKDDIGPIKIKEYGRGKGTDAVHRRDATEDRAASGDAPDTQAEVRPGDRDIGSARFPENPKIIDYDQEYAEEKTRERIGSMKIVDVDEEDRAERDREWERLRASGESEIGSIKIIESDG